MIAEPAPSSTGTSQPVEDARVVDVSDRSNLQQRAVALAWLTVVWNAIEAVVSIAAGWAAGSLVLIGFGLDSTIEVASALVIIWQFAGLSHDREQRALRLIALSFFALAGYVAFQAAIDLIAGSEAEPSMVGVALAAVSLVVMPVLALAKRSTGRRMGSATVTADSQQTVLCAYLSIVVLIGLLLNATLGWWWADPVAAVVIAMLAVREGVQTWRGENCCG